MEENKSQIIIYQTENGETKLYYRWENCTKDFNYAFLNPFINQTMEFGNRALIAGSTCSMASILKIDPFIQKGSWRIDVGEDGDYIECNNETENIDNYVSAANVIIGTISTSISALSFASSLSTDIVFEDISESMIVTIGEKYGI